MTYKEEIQDSLREVLKEQSYVKHFEQYLQSIYVIVHRCEDLLDKLIEEYNPERGLTYPPYSEEFRNRELWTMVSHYKHLRALSNIGIKYVKDLVDTNESELLVVKHLGKKRVQQMRDAIERKWRKICNEEKQADIFSDD